MAAFIDYIILDFAVAIRRNADVNHFRFGFVDHLTEIGIGLAGAGSFFKAVSLRFDCIGKTDKLTSSKFTR